MTDEITAAYSFFSAGQTDTFNSKAEANMTENKIDLLVEKAAQDEAFLTELYKELATSDVYVILSEEPDPQKSIINLQNFFKDEESFIPFFSSESNLKQATEGMPLKKTFYMIKGVLFFSLFKDNELLIINPGCRVTREFRADEFKPYLP